MNHNPLNNSGPTPPVPNLIKKCAYGDTDFYIRTNGQRNPHILFREQKGTKKDDLAKKTSDPDLTHSSALEKLSPVKL